MLPGIVLLQNSAPTEDQRAAAALLFAGPKSAITGVQACRRLGLRTTDLPADNRIHLLVPHEHKLLSSAFVTVERTRRMPEPVLRRAVPVAPLVRSVLDAARSLRTRDPVAKLLIAAVQQGHCSINALATELELGSTRGTAIPRRLLTEISDLRSVAELHARRVGEQLNTAPTHWNTDLFGPNGHYIGCPDGWWDDVALAWEIDSLEFHFRSADYKRTLERNTRYAAAGVAVVQTLPSRLLEDPASVICELESAYQAASQRPRPPVHLARLM